MAMHFPDPAGIAIITNEHGSSALSAQHSALKILNVLNTHFDSRRIAMRESFYATKSVKILESSDSILHPGLVHLMHVYSCRS